MRGLGQDLRHALRTLRSAPGFTAVAIVTLALGIGANAGLFGAIDRVLLRPLPFPHAGELYAIDGTYQGARREFTSFTDFADWRSRSRTFSGMAAIRGDGVSVTTPQGPEFLAGAAVSEDFFALLGAQPLLGRAFVDDEFRPGGEHAVVLGEALWRRRFGGSPAIVGTSIVLQGEPHTIVGVAPPGFAFPEGAELWRPLALTRSDAARRADLVRVIGRVRPGVRRDDAQADVTAIARQLEQQFPATNTGWGVEVINLQTKLTEHVERTLLALWGAVVCVLLIACANIGIMLLSRGIRRAPELALRAALGAGRSQVVRLLLAESVLLALLGGVSGLVVAAWGGMALRAAAPMQLPSYDVPATDGHVLLFTIVTSLVAGLAVGVVPAWRILRSDLHGPLREGAAGLSPAVHQHRLMRVLAVVQIAVSLVLLTGAGLMMRTLQRLQEVELGFDADRLLTFYVSLPEPRYARDEQMQAFFRTLLDRLRVLPGVRGASAINALYIHWSNSFLVSPVVEGRARESGSHPPDTRVRIVDPDVHRVLRVPIIRGGTFTARDGPGTTPVAVVNDAMARRYFGGEDPIGRRIAVLWSSPDQPLWLEIVGVVGNVRQQGLDAEVFPEIQLPYTQSPVGQMAIVVRTAGPPRALVPTVRAAAQAIDPDLPLTFVQTMDDVLADSTAGRRFGMRLLSAFATMALMLTAIGLYGVVAATVGDRTRELAVRLALGASPRLVVGTVVGESVVVAAAGLGIGTAAAFVATRYLEPLLFGVPNTDPSTYAATAAVLAVVALLSGYLPARRVTRLDPAAVLRS